MTDRQFILWITGMITSIPPWGMIHWVGLIVQLIGLSLILMVFFKKI